MALTEQQKESIIVAVRPSGRGFYEALSDLGLEVTSQEMSELLGRLKIPRIPIEEWTQDQLQEEINRLETLKAVHPEKEARVNARIVEITALLE